MKLVLQRGLWALALVLTHHRTHSSYLRDATKFGLTSKCTASPLSLEVEFYSNSSTLKDPMSQYEFAKYRPCHEISFSPNGFSQGNGKSGKKITPGIIIKCGLQKKTQERNELYFKPKSLNSKSPLGDLPLIIKILSNK